MVNPLDAEIAEMEYKLTELKQARARAVSEEARDLVVSVLPKLLPHQLVDLQERLLAQLRPPRRSVRGAPVSSELLAQVKKYLIEHPQCQVTVVPGMFNLSQSYVSRIKADLRRQGLLPAKPSHEHKCN